MDAMFTERTNGLVIPAGLRLVSNCIMRSYVNVQVRQDATPHSDYRDLWPMASVELGCFIARLNPDGGDMWEPTLADLTETAKTTVAALQDLLPGHGTITIQNVIIPHDDILPVEAREEKDRILAQKMFLEIPDELLPRA